MALGRKNITSDIVSLKNPNFVYVFRLEISKPKHLKILFHEFAVVLMVSLPLISKMHSWDWVSESHKLVQHPRYLRFTYHLMP